MQIALKRIAGGETDAAVHAPPLGLPAEHFAAALVFAAFGAVGLISIAPELALGAFYTPRVVAVVHAFTLGWIMLSIFGALCQFLPVAIGRGLRWQWLAHVTFGLQALGAGAFVTGLLAARPSSSSPVRARCRRRSCCSR